MNRMGIIEEWERYALRAVRSTLVTNNDER